MARKYHRKRRAPRIRKDRSTPEGEHRPVLMDEILDILDPQPGQTFVDCTLGFAGHASEILARLGPTGMLLATDLDAENIERAKGKLVGQASSLPSSVGQAGSLPVEDGKQKACPTKKNPFFVQHSNFAGLPAVLTGAGIEQVDGLLADLGMSSMQVDDPERGFSFMRDGPLDMRMDRSRGRTAAELVNSLSAEELASAFTELGDEPQAETIALAIVAHRETKPFERTSELRAVIDEAAPVTLLLGPGHPPVHKQKLLPATRVFQALRILVNRELANLSQLLRVIPQIVKPGGVAAIISFHSGEDRLVKSNFREGLRTGTFSEGCDDAIRPSEEEKLANPRSRSAKLRWVRLSFTEE